MARTSSPSRVKSAARIDGATRIGCRISIQLTGAALRRKPSSRDDRPERMLRDKRKHCIRQDAVDNERPFGIPHRSFLGGVSMDRSELFTAAAPLRTYVVFAVVSLGALTAGLPAIAQVGL